MSGFAVGADGRWSGILRRGRAFTAVAALWLILLAAPPAQAGSICTIDTTDPNPRPTTGNQIEFINWSAPASIDCQSITAVSGIVTIQNDTTGGAGVQPGSESWSGIGGNAFNAAILTGPSAGTVTVRVQCQTGCQPGADVIDFEFINGASVALRDVATGITSDVGSINLDRAVDTDIGLEVEALLGGVPSTSGSVTFSTKSPGVTVNGSTTPVVVPVAGNRASATVRSSTAGTRIVLVQWDPDNDPGTPNTASLSYFITFADNLVLTPSSASTQGVFPDVGFPEFHVDLRVNGTPATPADGYCIDWTVTRPNLSTQLVACSPFSSGRASLDFETAMISVQGPANYGNWNVQGQVRPIFTPRAGIEGGAPPLPGINFPFGVAMFTLGFEPVSQNPVSGEPFAFPLRLLDQNGVGVPGYTIEFQTSQVSTVPTMGTTAPTQSDGSTQIQLTDIGSPSVDQLLVSAAVTGFPTISASTAATVVGLGLDEVIGGPGPGPAFTDSVTDGGVEARATIDSGTGPVPDVGVVIDFEIISGNGVFGNGSTTSQGVSDGIGIARSEVIRVPRTPGPIVVRASAPGRAPLELAVPVTASNYLLDSIPPFNNTIAYGTTLDLQVVLNAQKLSFPPTLLPDAEVQWIVSGPAGASVTSPTVTGNDGVATSTFTPGMAGPHTITARFNPAPALAAPPPDVNFVIDVAAAYLISPSSPAGGVATIGTLQSLPLEVFLDFGGTPASGETVLWSVISSTSSGGVADADLSAPSSATDTAGHATVDFQAGATGQYVIRATPTGVAPPAPFTDFTITVAGGVQTLSQVSGDGQQGVPGQALAEPLVVIARNSSVPVDGIGIDWSVTPSGAATITPNPSTTASGGISSVDVALSAAANAGTITVVARRQDAPLTTTSFIINAGTGQLPEVLEIVGGNNQRGLTGSAAEPLRVRYLVNGVPQQGAVVGWSVSGAATPASGASVTNIEGVAAFNVSFGATPGFATIFASTGGVNARFDIEAAGPLLEVVSGDNQSATPGTTLAPFVVQVSTPNTPSTPLADRRVTWTIESGGGVLSAAESFTGPDGRASTVLTMGPNAGPQTVRATLDSGESVLFEAAATAASLALFSGDGQRGPIETIGDAALIVSLTDMQGRPQQNESISWFVASGDATVFAETAPGGRTAESLTGPNGRAQIRFRFGASPGISIIEASHPSVGRPVRFTVEAQIPGLTIVSGNNQSGDVGSVLAEDLVVRIAPIASKALGGVTVFWEVSAGGGTLESATSLTDGTGTARNRLTLGAQPGENRVGARVTGGTGVTFVASASDSAAVITKVSGDNQTTLTPNTDSGPLVVRVTRSGSGAAISGAQIRWSGANAQFVASDGALVSEVSSITNAQGEARIVARVVDSGPATVTARGQGFATEAVTFTLQGAIANLENLTGRERDVAEAIDAACPALAALGSRSPEQEDFLLRCRELQRNSGQNPDQVEGALQQMTPDIGITLATAGQETLFSQMSNVTNYLLEARRNPQGGGQMDIGMLTADGVLPLSFLPSAILSDATDEGEGSAEGQDLGSGFSRWGFFATGQIGRGKYRDGDRTPDYEYDSGHITAGVDYRFNDNVIAGVALGFSRSTTELRDDRGELETSGWSLLGYGTWYNEAMWYVDGSLTVGSNDYDLTRLVSYDITAASGTATRVDQVADASTSGDQLGLTLSFGRDFQRGAWSLSTYLRGLYMKSEFDAYTERMLANQAGSGLALSVDAREITAVNATLGGRATYVMSRDWGILMPHALLEFEHRFEDDPAQLVARFAFDPTGTTFIQTGDEIDSDVVNIGLGLSALWPGGRSAFVQYERLMSASRLSQDTLSIGVRVEF